MAPTVPATKKREFDPKKFLATIGEGRTVVTFSKNKLSSRRGMRLTQSSTSRKARSDSLSYPQLAKKRPWAYWARESFSEKAAWPDSSCGWGLQPQRRTAKSCALTRRK